MSQRIELLLQVVSDYHNFCTANKLSTVSSFNTEELMETELDLISAAAKQPENFTKKISIDQE